MYLQMMFWEIFTIWKEEKMESWTVMWMSERWTGHNRLYVTTSFSQNYIYDLLWKHLEATNNLQIIITLSPNFL